MKKTNTGTRHDENVKIVGSGGEIDSGDFGCASHQYFSYYPPPPL